MSHLFILPWGQIPSLFPLLVFAWHSTRLTATEWTQYRVLRASTATVLCSQVEGSILFKLSYLEFETQKMGFNSSSLASSLIQSHEAITRPHLGYGQDLEWLDVGKHSMEERIHWREDNISSWPPTPLMRPGFVNRLTCSTSRLPLHVWQVKSER